MSRWHAVGEGPRESIPTDAPRLRTVSPCIWYVSKYVATPTSGGGAGRGYALMREFARLGYQSVIITSDSMGRLDAPIIERPYVIEEHEGITLCRVHALRYTDPSSTRRVLSWLDFERRLLLLRGEVLPQPDVIVVSSLSLLTVLNGLRMRRRYRCRLVFEVRDIWPLTLVEDGGYSPRNPFVLGLGAIEKLGYRRADAIVGTMPNLGEHVEMVTGRPLPTSCIPMGVAMEAAQSPETLPADYVEAHMPTGKFLVAYAGSLGISNAMEVFFECVESMQQDQNIHFVVLGDGQLRQAYMDRYGLLSNLTFAPRVPKANVHDFLTRCDLLYLSVPNSRTFDYGMSLNKLIDYMLAAKPIVASYSGYRSMIDESACGTFVPAGDAAALRNEVRRYAAMPLQARVSMGNLGRSWLLTNRTYPILAQDYLKVLLPAH